MKPISPAPYALSGRSAALEAFHARNIFVQFIGAVILSPSEDQITFNFFTCKISQLCLRGSEGELNHVCSKSERRYYTAIKTSHLFFAEHFIWQIVSIMLSK
jgi:hypothetical protein